MNKWPRGKCLHYLKMIKMIKNDPVALAILISAVSSTTNKPLDESLYIVDLELSRAFDTINQRVRQIDAKASKGSQNTSQ